MKGIFQQRAQQFQQEHQRMIKNLRRVASIEIRRMEIWKERAIDDIKNVAAIIADPQKMK